ncbi:MAG: TonB-dependent receptor [Acidobacteria bacterium]|nr:TonB-dependent receptor [Acidobacteriota bacterium]
MRQIFQTFQIFKIMRIPKPLVLALAATGLIGWAATGEAAPQARTIRATISGPRGVLRDAEVTLLRDGLVVNSATTDDLGVVEFSDVSAGCHELLVVAAPFPPQKLKVCTLDTSDNSEISVSLKAFSEAVSVTASRLPLPVVNSISEVRVLDEEDLRASPYQSLDDRLRTLPEFSLFRRSSSLIAHPTTQGVSLRGIGPSGVSRSLVLADGIPINDAFGGWVYWDRIPSLSLQQVELVNGGGSALYGNYALGGVVQLLKRVPTPATIEFQAQGGSRGALKGDLYASHRIGDWGLAFSAAAFDFNGWTQVRESQRGAVDIASNSRHQAARFQLERAASGTLWTLEGGLLNEDRANGTPLQNNDTVSFDASTGFQFSPSSSDRIETRAFFRRTIFGSTAATVAAGRNTETLASQQHVPSTEGGASLVWFATRGRHSLVSGTDLWIVSGQSTDNIFTAGRFASVRYGGGKQSTFGLFAEENFTVSPRFALVVGGRVDFFRNFNGRTGSFVVGSPAIRALKANTETVFSPRGGFSFEALPQMVLHGSLYRSFRAPTLNELYRDFRVGTVLTTANSALQPERNTGFDLGARFPVSSEARLGLTGFWNFLDAPVSNVTLSNTPALITRQRQNLGAVRVAGLEASATWQPVSAVKASATYLWNGSVVTKFNADPQLNVSLIDKNLPQVARHRFTLAGDFRLPQRVGVSLIGRFVGEQFDDDLNSVVLPNFFQLDAHVSRGLGEFARLFVAIENLNDAKIITNRSPVDLLGTPFQVRGGIHITIR